MSDTTNRTFLSAMLDGDERKDEIIRMISNSFGRVGSDPMEMPLEESYRQSWEMSIPRMLACSSNNEHHIAHNICHDLTNIRYDFMKEALTARLTDLKEIHHA